MYFREIFIALNASSRSLLKARTVFLCCSRSEQCKRATYPRTERIPRGPHALRINESRNGGVRSQGPRSWGIACEIWDTTHGPFRRKSTNRRYHVGETSRPRGESKFLFFFFFFLFHIFICRHLSPRWERKYGICNMEKRQRITNV